MLSRLPLRVHDRIFIAAPLFHTWGYACLQMAIALRMTIVLEPRFDPERTLAAVARHGCTVLAAVPVMTQRIVELPAATRDRYPVRRLRVVAVSGSALPAGLAPRFRAAFGDRLYNLYGSTEVSCVSIATPADLRADPASAGRPIAGTAISIVDAAGRPVAQGESGQICVANPMVFDGYTDGTARELVDGLVRTGDTGHLDRAGRLVVDGRDDEMIVSGGENVFPRQVEAAVGELPQVSEVAVVGVADAEFGQRLAAFVVRRPDDTGGTETFGPDDVRQHVRTRLARFAVPRDVHFVPELPRNATGKVLIRELAARAEQGAARPR
jgi:acyl-CoA synthetase (AMP-forming)/AMP-acid ligase II